MAPRGIFTDSAVNGFTQQIGMTGVSSVLLDHVHEKTPDGDLVAVAEVPRICSTVRNCGLQRRTGPINSVVPSLVEIISSIRVG